MQDVQHIDFGMRGNADGPVQGTAVDALHQCLAPRRTQLLGITNTRKDLAGGQHHRGRDHSASQRPAPGLVDAGHGDGATARVIDCQGGIHGRRDYTEPGRLQSAP